MGVPLAECPHCGKRTHGVTSCCQRCINPHKSPDQIFWESLARVTNGMPTCNEIAQKPTKNAISPVEKHHGNVTNKEKV